MSNWKFKVGDVIEVYGAEGMFTVVGNCLEYGIENYILRNKFGNNININKDMVEDLFVLQVKPKSLYEQALELVGLKPMEKFIFRGQKYYFDMVGNLVRLQDFMPVKEYYFGLEKLLLHKDEITKPKSEAELILDELEKVVGKAKAVLERSGR